MATISQDLSHFYVELQGFFLFFLFSPFNFVISNLAKISHKTRQAVKFTLEKKKNLKILLREKKTLLLSLILVSPALYGLLLEDPEFLSHWEGALVLHWELCSFTQLF
jgi:hypothetical protein